MKNRALSISLGLACCGLALVSSVGTAQPVEAPVAVATAKASVFTRTTDRPDGTVALELANVVYTPKDQAQGPRIHLISAVHIADKPFYERTQKLLDGLDLVLFEGVKPPGMRAISATMDEPAKIKVTRSRIKFLLAAADEARSADGTLPTDFTKLLAASEKRWRDLIERSLVDAWNKPLVYAVEKGENGIERAVITSIGPDGTSSHGEGDDIRLTGKNEASGGEKKPKGLQPQMASALKLTFQTDGIDTTKPNWRSSDMSIDEVQEKLEAAGVKNSALFSMLDGSSFTGQLASFMLNIVKASPTLSTQMKLMMVEMLGSPDAVDSAAPKSMRAMMNVILHDRNAVVIEDLRGVLASEKHDDIAIFYGAGHMAGLEQQLISELGYVRQSEEWTTAITVDPKDAGMTEKQAAAMRKQVRKSIEGMNKKKPKN